MGLIGGQLRFSGWFWDGVAALNDNFNGLGFIIVGVFIVAWVGSVIVYRYKGLDRIEIATPARLIGSTLRGAVIGTTHHGV